MKKTICKALSALGLVLGSSAITATPASAQDTLYYYCTATWSDQYGATHDFIVSNVFAKPWGTSSEVNNGWKFWLNNNRAPSGRFWNYTYSNCVSYSSRNEAISQRTSSIRHYEDNVGSQTFYVDFSG